MKQILENILKETESKVCVSYDHDPTPTAEERLSRIKELVKSIKSDITFNEYKEKAITTKIYPPGLAIPYVTLGLMGEAGEVAEKVKKVIRDDNGYFTEEKKQLLGKEIGDVLWYCAALADELNLDFGQIAQDNINKLQARKEKGTLKGSGDNR